MYLTIDNAVLSSSKYEDAMNHKVYMIQTHSDFVINQRVYPQAEVEKAQETFYKPYNKPVLLHHDDYSDPIGRVVNQVFFLENSQVKQKNCIKLKQIYQKVQQDSLLQNVIYQMTVYTKNKIRSLQHCIGRVSSTKF